MPCGSWLSGPGPEEEPRGAHLGPRAVSPLQPGYCPELCCCSSISSAEKGQAAQERAEAAIATLQPSRGFRSSWHGALILRGWALAEQGQAEEGIAQMHQGLTASAGHGSRGAYRPYYLALLAEAYGKAGQTEEGLDRAGRGASGGGQNWGAFLRGGAVSAKGELTLQSGQVRKSQASSGKSSKVSIPVTQLLDTPRRSRSVFSQSHRDCSEATSQVLELRAATSLAVCGSSKARQPKLTSCCLRSTTGSPKGLTRRTCKRRRRCWTNSHDSTI